MEDSERVCKVCGETKNISEFHRHSYGSILYTCKVCYQAYYKEYLAKNIERRREVARESERRRRKEKKRLLLVGGRYK